LETKVSISEEEFIETAMCESELPGFLRDYIWWL